MVTTATAFSRTNGHVLASPGVVAELLAGADGEARSELTGRRHGRACSGARLCTLWRARASLGARVLARVVLHFGVHRV